MGKLVTFIEDAYITFCEEVLFPFLQRQDDAAWKKAVISTAKTYLKNLASLMPHIQANQESRKAFQNWLDCWPAIKKTLNSPKLLGDPDARQLKAKIELTISHFRASLELED